MKKIWKAVTHNFFILYVRFNVEQKEDLETNLETEIGFFWIILALLILLL